MRLIRKITTMFCAALVLLMLAVSGHAEPISCLPRPLTRFHSRIAIRPHNLLPTRQAPPNEIFDPPPVDILDLCATSTQLREQRPERGIYWLDGWRAGFECINGRLNNERTRTIFNMRWGAYVAHLRAYGRAGDLTYAYARLEEQRVFVDLSNFCKIQCWCEEDPEGGGKGNGGEKTEEDKLREDMEALFRMPVSPRLPGSEGYSENGLNAVLDITGSAQTDIGLGIEGAAGLAKQPTGADAALGSQQSAKRRESRRKAGLSSFPLGAADASDSLHDYGMSWRKAGLIDILANEALARSTLGRRKQK